MKQQNNKKIFIESLITKRLLSEEKNEKSIDELYNECDDLIRKMQKDIKKLEINLKKFGVTNSTKLKGQSPLRVLNDMYRMIHNFAPTSDVFSKKNEKRPMNKNSNDYGMQRGGKFPKDEMGINNDMDGGMREADESNDIKMPVKADREMEKKTIDTAKKYDMDVQLVDEITESVIKRINSRKRK